MEDLPTSEAFPYLLRKIANNNSDWLAIYQNLRKAQRRWGIVAKVPENAGETVLYQGSMYKAVAQSVILYGRESWVVMGGMPKFLEGFHHQSAR